MTDSSLITIYIDGVPYQVPAGMNLVDAARIYANVEIPIFCYHPKMDAVGMCRMCLVDLGFEQRDRQSGELALNPDGTPQIRWGRKLETACTTRTAPGMYIRTTTEQVQEARRDVLEFLLSSHPLDCPICDKGGECPLQNLTMRHGPGISRMYLDDKMRLAKHYPLGDLIYLDRERCIQCARCTRFQAEVVGDDVLAFHERGRRLQIITVSDPPFDTYFSGNTTDICPVGALTTADFRFGARPWELTSVPTICPHCPVGCNMVAQVRQDRDSGGVKVIKRILPRQNEDVNEIWICDKGRFGHHHSLSADRLRAPMIRREGALVAVSWDEALAFAAEGIHAAGNDVGVIGGPMLSNEDAFALRQLAAGLGSEKAGLWPASLGDPRPVDEVGVASGTNLKDLGKGDAILVIASDVEEEAPVWFLQIKQAADRGAALIVANTRPTKLDRYATEIVRYQHGEVVPLLNDLLATARKNNGLNQTFITEHVTGFDKLARSLGEGVDDLASAAGSLAGAANLIVAVGNDAVTPDEHTALLQAAANFLILTGHVGKKHNGLLPIWPGANIQGAIDMGLSAEATRLMFSPLPAALILADADVATNNNWAAALDSAGFIVHLTMFLDNTAEYADVVLPIQSFAERDGTFTNGMRRVQRFYQAHGPAGAGLPAWEVIAMLGNLLGQGAPHNGAPLVMRDIAAHVKEYAKITYPALAKVEPQLPPIGESPEFYGGTSGEPDGGTGIQLPAKSEGRGKLSVKVVKAPEIVRSGTGDLLILPVRRLYDRAPEFYASELMHGRIPEPFAGMNPADAERLGLIDGDTITIRTTDTEITVTALVDDGMPEGTILLPLRLTSDPTPFVPVMGSVEKAPVILEEAVAGD